MTKTKAIAIIKDIHTDNTDPEDKLTAIQDIVNMETHNSVTKQSLIEVLRWILDEYL